MAENADKNVKNCVEITFKVDIMQLRIHENVACFKGGLTMKNQTHLVKQMV